TEENTYSPPSGGRHCKECTTLRGKDRYYRLKRERQDEKMSEMPRKIAA
ncbi:hypothetical protein LCGC14_2668440, partial [marine sediment metagenome]